MPLNLWSSLLSSWTEQILNYILLHHWALYYYYHLTIVFCSLKKKKKKVAMLGQLTF